MTRLTRVGIILSCLLTPLLAEPQPRQVYFDISAASNLSFHLDNGMVGDLSLAEISGAGIAVFDLEGDGDLDLYLVQGQLLGPAQKAIMPREDNRGDRLLRNDAGPGHPPRFTDITEAAGLADSGYGMGVAVADIDADGFPDILVTNLGPDRMWRNLGNGRFEDVTATAGIGDDGWSTGATFADLDADGDLDLYLARYVAWDGPRKCFAASSAPDYCGPDAYPPTSDRLYRNRGDGRFEDVTIAAGLARSRGAGFVPIAVDLDADDRLDLYVANDGDPNFLFANRGDWRFEDTALLSGTAVDAMGKAQASMGLDAADIDGDGDFDLVMTHLAEEVHTFYRNLGDGQFVDASVPTGLARERGRTGFGAAWVDVDGDGWQDLVVVNGAVAVQPELAKSSAYPLGQVNEIYLNRSGKRLERLPTEAVPAFALREVSRGLAVGDIDSDGDPDLLYSNSQGPTRLLDNQAPARSWIGLRLLEGRRDALGAVVIVTSAGRRLVRRAHSDGSYLSSSDPRVLVGLADTATPVDVEVIWVGGEHSHWKGLEAGRYHTLIRPVGETP